MRRKRIRITRPNVTVGKKRKIDLIKALYMGEKVRLEDLLRRKISLGSMGVGRKGSGEEGGRGVAAYAYLEGFGWVAGLRGGHALQ
jgi:hypothetical protein